MSAILLPDLIVTSESLEVDCADNDTAICNQVWFIEVTRTAPKCDFNGGFNYSLGVGKNNENK